MYEALIGVVPDEVSRGASSIFTKWTKKIRKFIGDDKVFKDLWRTLRDAGDTAAAMAGIPLEELRRQLNNRGVDADKGLDIANAALKAKTDPNGNLIATAEEINEIWKQAEEAAKDPQAVSPDMKMILLGGLALFLMPSLLGGRGGGRGRGRRRRGKFRRRFR